MDFVSFRRRAYFHASRRRVLKRLRPYSRRPTGPVVRTASQAVEGSECSRAGSRALLVPPVATHQFLFGEQ